MQQNDYDCRTCMKNLLIFKIAACVFVICLICGVAGCSNLNLETVSEALNSLNAEESTPLAAFTPQPSLYDAASTLSANTAEPQRTEMAPAPALETPSPNVSASYDASEFSYYQVPQFSGAPYTEVNYNTPFFEWHEITDTATERYNQFDSLGRCGRAWASVGVELMPQTERGDISSVTPTGWNQAKVDGQWLYNRCHLIGYQLTAEDARPQNLITGTRYLNMMGMLPFENMVADYVRETVNHVMYRATPCFVGDELVCRGVLLEGLSVEDGGEGICFCVFAYNVQPGVELNYADGSIVSSELPVSYSDAEFESSSDDTAAHDVSTPTAVPEPKPSPTTTHEVYAEPIHANYIGNKHTGKFHHSSCSSVDDMNESNKVPLYSREEAIDEGYVPCKRCKP